MKELQQWRCPELGQWWCTDLRWNQECHGGPFAQESRYKKKREKDWEEEKKMKLKR
ncbi:hypothetical protein Bca52824_077083 [Brassica carinata]|uniref:Uncharacterized protein n=1 Tax=Brassica carinata TaxID=52824 RepID=A0A8X7TXX2_BRACI|nr:hypothetical protein Bca52824_077083 [Brassica carinata]